MTERTVYESVAHGRILTATVDQTVYEAACRMTEANCGSIVVVDGNGAMVGIVTERDLMTKVVAKALDPAKALVAEIMTKNPRFVMADTSVSEAVMMMKEGGFRHLPILSTSYKLIGVFSIRDATPRELREADRRAEMLELVSESVGY